jgi:hypothetical protein
LILEVCWRLKKLLEGIRYGKLGIEIEIISISLTQFAIVYLKIVVDLVG